MMACPGGRARQAQRRLAGSLARLALGLLLGTCPVLALATEPSRFAGNAEPETLVVQITLNAENKGQYFVSLTNDDFLVRVQDLEAMRLAHLMGPIRKIDSDELVSLKSIDGLSIKFDEKKLALELIVDPMLLPKRTLDFAAERKLKVYYPTDTSAFLNYDLAYSGGNAGQRDVFRLTNELGARIGDYLFLTDSTYTASPAERKFVRLMTSLIHDRRETLERTVAGDFFASSGDLGTTVNLGGLSYSKLYSIDPYFVRYPQQTITGQLATPSEVDIYLDGQRIRTLRLPPGEFEFRNITQSLGLRGVDIVIRDAFGREQRIGTNYYSTDVPLKAGLQEYSYNVGALREMFGVASDSYGPIALSAFHRYGVTDALTLGVRGEAARGVYNAGPTASMVLGAGGVLNASAAVSDQQGRGGSAALASYTYIGQHFSAGLLLRKESRHYATLVNTGIDRRNYEAVASIGYSAPSWGSVVAGYSMFKAYEGQDRKTASLSYGRPLFNGRASFFATLTNTRAKENINDVFVGLIYNFDSDYAASVRYQRFGDTRSEVVQFQKAQPIGEGLGYTIAFERDNSPAGTTNLFTPSLQYNSRWGILRADVAQQNDSTGSRRSYELSAAGGIAYVGNTFAVGRPVTDSFGLVKVEDIAGVRVFVNSQEIGKTDASGKVFLPTLTSFYDNQVSINTANVPLEYSFPEAMRVVSPGYRSGAVIDFHAKRLRAVTGTLKIRSGGQVKPAEFYEVSLAVDGTPFMFVTGRGGEYYVEDLKPGRYAARLAGNGQTCAFAFVVPQTQEPFTELPEIVCDKGN